MSGQIVQGQVTRVIGPATLEQSIAQELHGDPRVAVSMEEITQYVQGLLVRVKDAEDFALKCLQGKHGQEEAQRAESNRLREEHLKMLNTFERLATTIKLLSRSLIGVKLVSADRIRDVLDRLPAILE